MLQERSVQVLETFKPLYQQPKHPEFHKPEWFDSELPDTYEGRCRAIVRDFVQGGFKGKRVGWKTAMGQHVFTTKGNELFMFKDNRTIKVNICVAKKVNGIFIGNASSLVATQKADGTIGWVGSYGLKIQESLQDVMPMVPFQMFKEARLDLDSFQLIEKGKDETIQIRGRGLKPEPRHFTGAMLFKLEVRKRSREMFLHKEDYFLFDVDRNDLAFHRFNAFLSKLSRPCSSIQDAYASLKPKVIEDAERFMEQPCPRQGEWFFIPVQGEFELKKEKKNQRGWALTSKGNRPHNVQELSVEGYARGRVWHGGGEHEPIDLKQWHKPVPNTAVESFKISGAVD